MKAAAAVLGGCLAGSSGSPCSWIAFNFWPKMVVIRTGLWADLRRAHPSPSCQRLGSNSPPLHLQSKAALWPKQMGDGDVWTSAQGRRHMLACVIRRRRDDGALVPLACICFQFSVREMPALQKRTGWDVQPALDAVVVTQVT